MKLNHLLNPLLIVLFTVSGQLLAKSVIFETNNFSDVTINNTQLAPENTLFVFDIDKTLLIVEDCKIADFKVAAHIRWLTNVKACPAHLTEDIVPDLFEELKLNGFKILGLTARSFDLLTATERELSRNNLFFSEDLMDDFVVEWKPGKKWYFQKGVTYADGKAKGLVMKDLLAKVPFAVKNVVFVDDNKDNVKSVSSSFKKSLDVDVFVVHYRKYDQ